METSFKLYKDREMDRLFKLYSAEIMMSDKHEIPLGYGLPEEAALELRNMLDRAFSNITFYLKDDGSTWGVGAIRRFR